MGFPIPDLPELLGGRLCLDFVNTVHHRFRDASRDYLEDYPSWLGWSVHAGALSADEAARLGATASTEPRLAARAFDRALAFRGTAHSILLQRMTDSDPEPALVGELNELLALAAPLRVLKPGEQGEWSWSWREGAIDLGRPLFAVAVSFAELLEAAPPDRVKQCPAPDGCGWFFLDQTKNGSRRWCSMNHCGTTSKARRYLRKKRQVDAH